MRVVCINNKITRRNSKGEFYEVIDELLNIGKSYETFMAPIEFEICSVVGLYDDNADLIGDRVYDKCQFTTLEEWREMQLKKIL